MKSAYHIKGSEYKLKIVRLFYGDDCHLVGNDLASLDSGRVILHNVMGFSEAQNLALNMLNKRICSYNKDLNDPIDSISKYTDSAKLRNEINDNLSGEFDECLEYLRDLVESMEDIQWLVDDLTYIKEALKKAIKSFNYIQRQDEEMDDLESYEVVVSDCKSKKVELVKVIVKDGV